MKDSRLWLFQRLLALCLLLAWWSLGSQVLVLVGEHGLLPFAPVLARIKELGLSLWQLPSVFRWGVSDRLLVGGCWFGAGLALFAVLGLAVRWMFALSLVLYFSYSEISGPFLSFQWDNLLLEATALALLGSYEHTARVKAHGWRARLLACAGGSWSVFLLRVLLFKLYFESGLAKLQSPTGDWLDGSAMRVYYETAPLPGPLAWYAHTLPAWFHKLESWATLAFELLLPLCVFGTRRARWLTCALLTAFQLFNICTANYGFFSYLSLALHVVLFNHDELRGFAARGLGRGVGRKCLRAFRRAQRLSAKLRFWTRRAVRKHGAALPRAGNLAGRWLPRVRAFGIGACVAVYTLVSLEQGLQQFVNPQARLWGLSALDTAASHFRLINTYHLFAQITTERLEPVFSVSERGQWSELSMSYKPGPLDRGLPLVAPHQPRVDFLLWFYGLRFRGAPPNYVRALLQRMCQEPSAVAALFVEPLPRDVERVRVAFFQYHFVDAAARAETGRIWRRTELAVDHVFDCKRDGSRAAPRQ